MAKFWTDSTPWLISASEAFSKIRKRCATRFCWVFGVRSDMYARMPSTTLGGMWKRAWEVNRMCACMSWYALDVANDTQAWSAGADVKRPTMCRMQKWKWAIGKARWVGLHPPSTNESRLLFLFRRFTCWPLGLSPHDEEVKLEAVFTRRERHWYMEWKYDETGRQIHTDVIWGNGQMDR